MTSTLELALVTLIGGLLCGAVSLGLLVLLAKAGQPRDTDPYP